MPRLNIELTACTVTAQHVDVQRSAGVRHMTMNCTIPAQVVTEQQARSVTEVCFLVQSERGRPLTVPERQALMVLVLDYLGPWPVRSRHFNRTTGCMTYELMVDLPVEAETSFDMPRPAARMSSSGSPRLDDLTAEDLVGVLGDMHPRVFTSPLALSGPEGAFDGGRALVDLATRRMRFMLPQGAFVEVGLVDLLAVLLDDSVPRDVTIPVAAPRRQRNRRRDLRDRK